MFRQKSLTTSLKVPIEKIQLTHLTEYKSTENITNPQISSLLYLRLKFELVIGNFVLKLVTIQNHRLIKFLLGLGGTLN